MTEEELLARGTARKLIFENFANGVPVEKIMTSFRRSREEVDREVAFVGRKIAEYRFQRHEPPLACETLIDIRVNRRALLETLRKLGPKYMSSELLLPSIKIQKLDSPGMVREASQRAGIRIRQ